MLVTMRRELSYEMKVFRRLEECRHGLRSTNNSTDARVLTVFDDCEVTPAMFRCFAIAAVIIDNIWFTQLVLKLSPYFVVDSSAVVTPGLSH